MSLNAKWDKLIRLIQSSFSYEPTYKRNLFFSALNPALRQVKTPVGEIVLINLDTFLFNVITD